VLRCPKKGGKEGKEEIKTKEGVVYGVVFLLLHAGPAGIVEGDGDSRHASSLFGRLGQCMIPVNLGEIPHPITGDGVVK